MKSRSFFQDSIRKKIFSQKFFTAISEGYKLIFNFGKNRMHPLWHKLYEEIRSNDIQELIIEMEDINKKLVNLGNRYIDKELRDITTKK